MNHITRDEIKSLLQAMQRTTEKINKLPANEADDLAEKMDVLFTFFCWDLEKAHEEKAWRLLNNIKSAVNTLLQTHIVNTDILQKAIEKNDMNIYTKYCLFSTKTDPETKLVIDAVNQGWMSADRVFYALDRYEIRYPISHKILQREYSDEQAKALWLQTNAYRECLKHQFNISAYITPEATVSAITGTFDAAHDLLSDNHPVKDCLAFLDGRIEEYKYGPVIRFIANMNAKYPIQKDWSYVIPKFLPRHVMAEIDKACQQHPKTDKSYYYTAMKILEKWNGFTITLENYYESVHVYGYNEMYDTWQNDVNRTGLNGDALAVYLTVSRPNS